MLILHLWSYDLTALYKSVIIIIIIIIIIITNDVSQNTTNQVNLTVLVSLYWIPNRTLLFSMQKTCVYKFFAWNTAVFYLVFSTEKLIQEKTWARKYITCTRILYKILECVSSYCHIHSVCVLFGSCCQHWKFVGASWWTLGGELLTFQPPVRFTSFQPPGVDKPPGPSFWRQVRISRAVLCTGPLLHPANSVKAVKVSDVFLFVISVYEPMSSMLAWHHLAFLICAMCLLYYMPWMMKCVKPCVFYLKIQEHFSTQTSPSVGTQLPGHSIPLLFSVNCHSRNLLVCLAASLFQATAEDSTFSDH